MGESGSGKTTLALAILRLIAVDRAGRVSGRRTCSAGTAAPLRDLRRDMQVVFQDPYGSLSPRMTVEQIIAEGLGVHGVEPGRNRREMVAEIMARGRPRPGHDGTAIRMNSPAASASASPSPAR